MLVFITDVGLFNHLINNLIDLLLIRNVSPIFSHYPRDNLHQRLWDVRVLLKHFQVNLNGAVSELFAILLLFIFSDTLDEFIGQILSNEVSTHLKKFVHDSNVPIFIWCELFAEFINLHDKVFAS